MRHLFLINPVAGKGIRPTETAEEIQQLMKNRPESYRIRVTEYKGHAEELTRQAAEESQEPLRVYAFGGDGSLNEVVNGGAGYAHAAVTVLPRGSGNDFLKLFTTGQERFRYLHNLIEGKTAALDLIDCNGRLAVNIASVGLDARVGVEMARFKHLPLVSGSLAYVLSLAVNVVRGIGQHYRVELDGQRMEGDYTLLAVCNGRWYGGGFCPVPDAMPDDGLLDFVLVKQVSRMKVAQLVSQYAQGRGRHYPGLIRMSRGHTLRVEADRETVAQLDGEELRGNSLSFTLSAKKINFIYPDGAGWLPEK